MTIGWPGGVWTRRLLQFLLTAAVTWIVVRAVGAGLEDALSLRPAIPDPSTPLLLASAVLLLVGLATSAVLWGGLASELGGRRLGRMAALRIVFAANLGRYLPGRLWPIAGLALLSERNGMSGTVAAAAGVLGQAFALGAAGVLAAPALLGRADGTRGETLVLLTALALCLAALSLPRVRQLGLALALRIARVAPQPSAEGRLFGLRWFASYLLNWILYGGAFVLFVRGLGFAPGALGLVSAFAGAYLLGYAAFFAPAGIGVREGFLIAFLRPELGGGAVGVAILTRLWMTGVELLPAGGLAIWEVVRTPRGRKSSGFGE